MMKFFIDKYNKGQTTITAAEVIEHLSFDTPSPEDYETVYELTEHFIANQQLLLAELESKLHEQH